MKLRRLVAGALAGVMTLGLVAAVGALTADAHPILLEGTDQTIFKDLQLQRGALVPEFEFNFGIELIELNGIDRETQVADFAAILPAAEVPSWTDDTITIDFGPDTATEVTDAAIRTVRQDAGEIFAVPGDHGFTGFTRPGHYVFRVTESLPTLPLGWVRDDGPIGYARFVRDVGTHYYELIINVEEVVYYLHVQVVNATPPATGLVIADVAATTDRATTVFPPTAEVNEKVAEIVFLNRHLRDNRTDEEEADDRFEVRKEVTGDLGDTTQRFSFNIVLQNDPLVIAQRDPADIASYTARIYGADGVVRDTITITVGGDNAFTLAHGERLVFDSIPVGTMFFVEETNSFGHTPSIEVNVGEFNASHESLTGPSTISTDAGVSAPGIPTQDPIEMFVRQSRENYSDINEVEVTNSRVRIPITGLIAENLTVIMIIVIAVGMLALTVIGKRRRAAWSA